MVDELARVSAAVSPRGNRSDANARIAGQALTREVQTMAAALGVVAMLFLVMLVWLAMKRAGKAF